MGSEKKEGVFGGLLKHFIAPLAVGVIVALVTLLLPSVLGERNRSSTTEPIETPVRVADERCTSPVGAYQFFEVFLGGTYYDETFYSDHYIYGYSTDDVEIGTNGSGVEEYERISGLRFGDWENVHQFQNTQQGAFALCMDSTGLYAAVVDYYF